MSNRVLQKIAIAVLTVISSYFAWLALLTPETMSSAQKSSGLSAMSAAQSSASSNGILVSALVFLTLLLLLCGGWKCFFNASCRIRYCSIGSSVLLGFSLVLSEKSLNPEVHRSMTDYCYMAFRYVGFFSLLVCLLCALYSWCIRKELCHFSLGENNQNFFYKKIELVYCAFNIKNITLVAFVVLLCWIPWIAMMYPANIGPDTVAQLIWMRTGHAWDPSTRLDLPGYALSDQHPWFDSLIYGAFDGFGLWMGNEQLGLFLLSLFHVLLLSFSFGVVLVYLPTHVGVPIKLSIGLTLFVALIPAYGRLSMSVVKDLTFMPFYLLWLVMYVEYVRRTIRKIKISGKFCCTFIALSVLCMVTRKIAFYILLFSFLLLLVFIKRKIVTAIFVAAIIAAQILVPKIVFPILHVKSAGTQEVIAIPLQQSAGILIEHKNEISVNDKRNMMSVFSCSINQMRRNISLNSADWIKDNCYNHESSKKDLIIFLKTWVEQSSRHAKTCWRYTSWLFQPFYMNSHRFYDEGFFVHWGWEDRGGNDILSRYQSHEKSSNQKIGEKIYMMFEQLPVVGVFMSEATYVLWIPVISLCLCIVLKRKTNVLIFIPFLMNLGVLVVSPAAQLRYSWSLLFGAVILISMPLMQLKIDNSGKNKEQ